MNKYLKLTFAIAISLAGLYFAFRGIEFDNLLAAMLQVNCWYILAAMTLMILSVVVRAWRWAFILEPIKKIKFSYLFSATMIGYFGNSVLPFRLGELLRAYSLARSQPISTSAAFGTIVLERVLDMIGVLLVAALFFVLYPFPAWLKISGLIAGLGTALIIIGLIVLSLTHAEIQKRIYGWGIFQNNLGRKFTGILDNLVSGLIALKSTHHILVVTVASIVLWLIYYFCTYLVVLSVDVPVDWIAAGVTLVATTLAITIPAAPGYIGTYHATAVIVMVELFGVALPEAQAFAVLVHAIGFVPFAVIGFGYFLTSSVRLQDIQAREIATGP
ncbi:MAG: lysylphosphatidylglycerol synthase transmembrane domain-containing protein [Candidatus Neomarinimicrobiota bacterium]